MTVSVISAATRCISPSPTPASAFPRGPAARFRAVLTASTRTSRNKWAHGTRPSIVKHGAAYHNATDRPDERARRGDDGQDPVQGGRLEAGANMVKNQAAAEEFRQPLYLPGAVYSDGFGNETRRARAVAVNAFRKAPVCGIHLAETREYVVGAVVVILCD